MRELRGFLVGLLMAAGVVGAAPTIKVRTPIVIGRRAIQVRAATAPGGTLTVGRSFVAVEADNTTRITLGYTNAAGVTVHQRMLLIPADGSKVVDQFGAVLATPAPAALVNAITTFTSQLDTLISNAASGGKLNL